MTTKFLGTALEIPAAVTSTQAARKGYVDSGDAALAARLAVLEAGGGSSTTTGGQTLAVRSTTAAVTANPGDFVLADAFNGAFIVTLPAHPPINTSCAVKKVDNSLNLVTIVGSNNTTIDGDSSCDLTQAQSGAVLVFDGTNWRVEATVIFDPGAKNFTYRGTWSSTAAYGVNDVVFYNRSAYVAVLGSTGTTPAVDASSATWGLLVVHGDDVKFRVGTTTTGAAGSNASVANSGTPTDAVLDFVIPQGAQGVPGVKGDPGADGGKGDKGDKGDQGSAGVTPVFTVSATGLPAGQVPVVTSGGTAASPTLSFGIPAGAAGTKGDQGDPGPMPVFTVSATGLAAGATPVVTSGGTAANPTLTFGIPAGASGADGVTPVFTVSATGLAAGATPTVTRGGTNANPTLAFGIPKGDPGDPGIKGDKGDTGVTPVFIVSAAGLAAGATPTVTAGGTTTNPTLTFGIPKGDTGAKGDKGDPGNAGAAATVTVGTTDTLESGNNASVTNGGTSAAAVLNFRIPRGQDGPPGAKGDKGDTGTAASVTVGTTDTLESGNNASVANSGTASAAVFNFKIPRGQDGPVGATPVISATATGLAAGAQPTVSVTGTPASPTLALGIPKGDPGAPGTNGTNGTNGVTPVFTAAATKLAATANPTASVTGTSANPVLTLGIPKGDPGADGVTPTFTATATSLGAGAQPTAAVGGTAANPTLALGIPRGDPGTPGTNGVTPTFTATATGLGAGAPPTASVGGTAANPILALGIPKGDPGTNGVTPAFTATATSLGAGAPPTASVGGTTTNPILALGIPKGDPGANGVTPTFTATATPLTAGAPPTASVGGTASNPILALGIPKGDPGAAGTNGAGVPAGGLISQILSKKTAQDYDTQWINAPTGGGSGGGLTPTLPAKTAAAQASAGDLVLCDASGGAFTVTAPLSPVAGSTFGVKKIDSSVYAVTVISGTTATIDGDQTCTVNVAEAAGTFVFDGSNWQIQSTALVNVGSDSVQSLWTSIYQIGYWYDRRLGAVTYQSTLASQASGTAGTNPVAPATFLYVPFYAHRAFVIDTVGYITSAAPAASASVRLGLMTCTSVGKPGTKIADWGLTTPAATTTLYSTTVASSVGQIPKGWSFFVMGFGSNSVGGIYSVPTNTTPLPPGMVGALNTFPSVASAQYGLGVSCYYETFTSATNPPAVPASASLSVTGIGFSSSVSSTPNIFFRVSG